MKVMKIMSLNVNRFCPVSILEGSKVHEIIAIIKRFLLSDENNVVFLQEVPVGFVDELKEVVNGGCKDFVVYKPKIDQYNYERTYTIAIVRSDSQWEPIDGEGFREKKRNMEKKREFDDKCKKNGQPYPWFYENKFIEIKNEKENLQLLGVHAPWQKIKENNSISIFFDALKEYALNKGEGEKFIIVGDLNADTVKESTYGGILKDIKQSGYYLAVEALGENVVTYFTGGTRIDHVMASPALNGKVTACVIPQEILELSDHAVIIVDVKM